MRSDVHSARYYARWCSERGLDFTTATTADVTAFVLWYQGRVAQQSVIRRLSAIKYLYEWLMATGVRPDNPARAIRLRSPDLPPKPPFTADELRRLIAATRTLRDRALVKTFAATGCRLSEVMGMRVEDVDFAAGTIYIRGKRQRHRFVAPGPTAMAALREYLHDAEQLYNSRSGPVWRSTKGGGPLGNMSAYYVIRRLGERAGVHAHPHKFRVTTACKVWTASHDLEATQTILGHQRVSSTMHYIGWERQERALDLRRPASTWGRSQQAEY
jgi:site-specific recombinase XerD